MKTYLVKLGCAGLFLAVMTAARGATADAYASKGHAEVAAGKYAAAVKDCTKAIALDPRNSDAYEDRAIARNYLGDYAGAVADCDKAIGIDPKDASAYVERGVAHEYAEQYREALRDLNKGVELDPTVPWGYLHRGFVYDTELKCDKAIVELNKAISMLPSEAPAYRVRGDAYDDKSEYALAVADYKKAMALDPNDPCVYDSYSRLLDSCPEAKFLDAKRALAYARKSGNLNHWKDPTAYATLAKAYAEAGDYTRAVQYEQRYLATPNLSRGDASKGRKILALFQHGKPYREKDWKKHQGLFWWV